MTPTFPPSPAQGETAGVSELPIKLREAADRILNHCFNKSGDSALVSIPADRSRDVDLLLFEAADQLEVARQQLAELHQSIADERIVFWEKDADQRKAIENREARLRAAEQQLAELREANAAALRVSLIHTATHEIAKVREERDEAREAVEDIEKERDKLLQQVAEMRWAVDRDYQDMLAVLYALRDVPTIPDPRVLSLLSKAGKFPDDWNAGKRMQNEHGLDAIPPNTECEIGAGFWKRLSAALAPTSQPSRGKCGCLSDDEHNWLTAAIMDLRAGESISGADAALILDRIVTRHCPGYPDCAQPERQGACTIGLSDDEIAAIGAKIPYISALTDYLSDDQWNNVEQALLTFARAIAALGEKGWIPVSEKHAPLYKDILVQDKNGHPSVSRYMGHGTYTHDRYPVLGQCKAVAWRELPDAYVPSSRIGAS